jgi:hypothetical protein
MINGLLGDTAPSIDRTQVNAQSKTVLANLKTTYTKCVQSSKFDCLCKDSGNILDGMYKKYVLSFEQGKVNLVDAEHNDMNIAHEDLSMNCYLIYKDTGDKYSATFESKNFIINLEKNKMYTNRPLLYKTKDGKVCWILTKNIYDYSLNPLNNKAIISPSKSNEKYVLSYLDSVPLCN